jgi:PAS domain-containing protein
LTIGWKPWSQNNRPSQNRTTISTQNELKKSEEDVHALLNATTDIAFLMDKDGYVLASNESAARAYHTTVEKLLGHLRRVGFPHILTIESLLPVT